jgi:hypothetical protein
MVMRKVKQFFFEKKNRKTFAPWSRAGSTGAAPYDQKSFAAFFQ